MVDSRLQEFTRLHHLDLIRKVNYQIDKFKDNIHEKKFFDNLYSYSLTKEQVMLCLWILCYLWFFFYMIETSHWSSYRSSSITT